MIGDGGTVFTYSDMGMAKSIPYLHLVCLDNCGSTASSMIPTCCSFDDVDLYSAAAADAACARYGSCRMAPEHCFALI